MNDKETHGKLKLILEKIGFHKYDENYVDGYFIKHNQQNNNYNIELINILEIIYDIDFQHVYENHLEYIHSAEMFFGKETDAMFWYNVRLNVANPIIYLYDLIFE